MLPDEFVVFIICGSANLLSFMLGVQTGRGLRPPAPVRVVDWARFNLELAPVPAPALVERAPGSYARFRWDMLTPAQWSALLRTTATNALCGEGLPFERGQFEQVRSLLIRLELAAWRDAAHHGKGWELGPALARAIAERLGMRVVPPPPGGR